jgi:hypothetical protein
MSDKTETDRNNIIAVRKFKSKADADELREQLVAHFMYSVIDAFKQKADLSTRVNSGAVEFEGFVAALMGGGTHPLLERWQRQRKGTPAADERELRARRLIVLMTIALERTGLSMAEARRFAAKETTVAGVFPGETITAKAVEHWAERQDELTPRDEQLVATSIACCGLHAQRRLALYFIGLAHFSHNPSVAIVREGTC